MWKSRAPELWLQSWTRQQCHKRSPLGSGGEWQTHRAASDTIGAGLSVLPARASQRELDLKSTVACHHGVSGTGTTEYRVVLDMSRQNPGKPGQGIRRKK